MVVFAETVLRVCEDLMFVKVVNDAAMCLSILQVMNVKDTGL